MIGLITWFISCLPSDPCIGRKALTYGHPSNCRGYWRCEAGKSIPGCCPMGFTYSDDGNCVMDPNCTSSCLETTRAYLKLLDTQKLSVHHLSPKMSFTKIVKTNLWKKKCDVHVYHLKKCWRKAITAVAVNLEWLRLYSYRWNQTAPVVERLGHWQLIIRSLTVVGSSSA